MFTICSSVLNLHRISAIYEYIPYKMEVGCVGRPSSADQAPPQILYSKQRNFQNRYSSDKTIIHT